MRKIAIVLTATMVVTGAYAQKNKVVSAYNYNKAFTRSGKCSDLQKGVEAINLAQEHESTKNNAKTWYYSGNLYYNILATKDEACKKISPDALNEATNSYIKTLVLNFEDAELKKLDLEKEEDLKKFFIAVQSKQKVSDESYTADIMGRKMPALAGEFGNAGIDSFTKKDYKGAKENFSKSMMLTSFSGKLDTLMLYNTALASEYSKDFETAKQSYDALIGLKYNSNGNGGAELYRSMSRMYKNEGNTEKSLEYVRKGREAYPNDNNLLVEELEYYLQNNKHQEALNNLNTAITNDPSNHVLYFARGTVYENLKDETKAVADYNKALEVKPDYYDAAFNLGAYYFNIGAEKINEANKLPLSAAAKYDAFKKESEEAFKKATPYVEKANELKPEDVDTANMLIQLYMKTSQFEKAKVLKAKYQ